MSGGGGLARLPVLSWLAVEVRGVDCPSLQTPLRVTPRTLGPSCGMAQVSWASPQRGLHCAPAAGAVEVWGGVRGRGIGTGVASAFVTGVDTEVRSCGFLVSL